MAKKTRTPPPPRRPGQTPGKRPSPSRGAQRTALDDRRRKQLFYGLGAVGAGAVAAIIAVALIGSSGKASVNDSAVASAMAAAGCTFKSVKPLPPTHNVQSGYHQDSPKLTSKVKWATFPPSGGGHYALWAVWSFYRDPVNPRQVVHNEEHGGVIIWWGPQVPKAQVDKLEAFYQSSPDGMLGTPIAGLDSKIALTAWTGDPKRYYQNHYYGVGKIATCSHFDQKAFAAFRDAYRGHGPEGIPLSVDQPGMGPNG